MLLAVQTGLRLSELTGLDRSSVKLGKAAHVRCFGKGRRAMHTDHTVSGRCYANLVVEAIQA